MPAPAPRTPWRALAAILAGALLGLGFAPYDLWWLVPGGVMALTLAVRGAAARQAAWLGLVAGVAFFVPLLQWSGIYVGPVPWLVLATYQAFYIGGLGVGLSLVQRLPGWPLYAACLWVGEEAVRGRGLFGGFTWGRLAFSQADSPGLGLAAVAGAPAVTFAVALAGSLVAFAGLSVASLFPAGRRRGGRLREQFRGGRPRRSVAQPGRRLGAAGLGVIAAATVLLGGVALPRPAPDGPRVQVALVQGNVPRLGLDFNSQRQAVLRNHVEATLQLSADVAAGRAPQPELVLWPENSSDIDPYTDTEAAALIDAAARAIKVPILVGAVTVTDDGQYIKNVGIVWDPATGPGATYVKRHPVPFGEYIPLRDVARLVSKEVDRVQRDMIGGDDVGALQVGPALVGDVICFEVAIDELPRSTVRAGAQLLAVQTNNATFGFTPQTEQQLAMARLRAVELARSVFVVSTSGVSAVIDPDGTVTQRAELFTRAVLSAQPQLSNRLTLAAKVGALPEVVLSLLGLTASVLAGWTARSRGARRHRVARDDVEGERRAEQADSEMSSPT